MNSINRNNAADNQQQVNYTSKMTHFTPFLNIITHQKLTKSGHEASLHLQDVLHYNNFQQNATVNT